MTTDETDRKGNASGEEQTAAGAEHARGAGTDDASGAGETAGQGADDAGSEGERASRRSEREMPFADNIHGLVDDILEGVRNFTPVASVRYPRYDFVETPGAYLLAFDLPGVTRDEISVTTEGEDVIVAGERTESDWGEEATIRRSERPFGGFRRALRMPADVRVEDIRARLEDGILTVTLPRHTDESSRKVDIEG